MHKSDKKLDQAARAAWMYYVAGQTQHEIAEALGVSRQVAQRLVACAIDNGLVSVNITHPVARCMALAEQLQQRYGLHRCQVVPSQGMDNAGVQRAIAVAGAEVMAQFLRQEQPLVIGVGSGRSLKAAIDELPDVERPQHSCVSLIGAIAADGSCTRYDVPLWMAEKTQGRYFILPAPLFADSAADRDLCVTIAFIAPSPKKQRRPMSPLSVSVRLATIAVTQRWFYFGARCGCLARIACGRGDAG